MAEGREQDAPLTTGIFMVGALALLGAAIAGALLLLGGSSAKAGPPPAFESGDIIVAESFENAVKSVDPTTGAVAPVASGGNLAFPADVTFAADGDALVVARDAFGDNGGIIRIDRDTGAQSTVSSNAVSNGAGGDQLFQNPVGIDRRQGSLFVSDFSADAVIEVDIATGAQTLASAGGALRNPFGITAAAKPLVADADAFGGNGGILRIHPDSGLQSRVSSGGKFRDPGGLERGGSGRILVTDSTAFAGEKGGVLSVDLKTGAQRKLVAGGDFLDPQGIARISTRRVIVSDSAGGEIGEGKIFRVNIVKRTQNELASGFDNPIGIGIAP